MITRLGTFGAPPDVAAWAAAAAAVVWVALYGRVVPRRPHPWLAALAAMAALTSWAYVVGYLGGAPRLIDATSYLLEARTLASGHFSFEVDRPLASYAGRFLLADASGERLGVIFPPGYPLALAPWAALGAPMVLGPLLAAALVAATYAVARSLFDDVRVGLLAAALSAVCACLRYHTADTMSHGWAALLGTLALLGATRRGASWALLTGGCLGWLACTRPVSTVAVAVGVLMIRAGKSGLTPRWALLAAVGLLPGVALLLAYGEALTGSWLGSPQLEYYARADGPPGCFRYGFGAGVGCAHEHGPFVQRYLPSGFGVLEALGTTARRLALHARDAGNSGVFGVVLLAAFWLGRGNRCVRVLTAVVATQVVAYAPFYFDGNVPGPGARMYADVLPFEHVAIAWLACRRGLTRWAVPLALAGFAVTGSYDHRHLAAREGGAPMYDPHVLDSVKTGKALVLVNTDHGFNLAYDPRSNDDRIAIARFRGDGNDRLAWLRLGRPPAFRVDFDPFAEASTPRLVAYDPAQAPYRFEGEHHWPLVHAAAGWARPVAAAPCASKGRGLELVAVEPIARFTIHLTPPDGESHRLRLGWIGEPRAAVAIPSLGDLSPLFVRQSGDGCWREEYGPVKLPIDGYLVEIQVHAGGGPLALDYVELGDPATFAPP